MSAESTLLGRACMVLPWGLVLCTASVFSVGVGLAVAVGRLLQSVASTPLHPTVLPDVFVLVFSALLAGLVFGALGFVLALIPNSKSRSINTQP